MDDSALIQQTVREVIAANPETVAQYKSGKTNGDGLLRRTDYEGLGGKANPKRSISMCATSSPGNKTMQAARHRGQAAIHWLISLKTHNQVYLRPHGLPAAFAYAAKEAIREGA